MRTAKCALPVFLLGCVLPARLGAAEPAKSLPKPVIAVFSLGRQIVEAPQGEDLVLLGSPATETLKDLVARMKKVRDDPQVKAVVLLLGGGSVSLAQVEELRQALDEIKAAGKQIHAHADSLSTGSYTLMCGASSISVVPTGTVWITGIHVESPYIRGLLDLLGIQPDFFTSGPYKSAAEIFMRKGPSPEAKQMDNWLLDSLYQTCVGLMAKGRGVSPELVRLWIDGGPYTAQQAKALGIIDRVEYQEDFAAELKAKYGADVKWEKRYGKADRLKEIDLSSPMGVIKLWMDLFGGPPKKQRAKDAVAIVYVDGPILLGDGQPSMLELLEPVAYSTPIRKALDEVGDDSTVKAVVLRVRSPGGSAVASEIILNATKRVKARKPFVVSMGSVAGSGGYYVACGAETIFADASTITASIGVVSGKFATTGMWNKVGITWDSNKRGAMADMLGSDDLFTPDERAKLISYMNEVYEMFKGHVSAVRGSRLKKPIDELAGGRVFTGQQALELGLVDRIGTLDDAIRFAASQANLKDYEVRVVPRPKSLVELLFSDLADRDADSQNLSTPAGKLSGRQSNWLFELAMPVLKGLDPVRLEAIKAALARMSLLQQERVILMMPELSVRLD